MQVFRIAAMLDRHPNEPREAIEEVYKVLRPYMHQKVVLVFKEAIEGRTRVARHACTLLALQGFSVLFSPAIPLPRKSAPDLKLSTQWLTNIDRIVTYD